MPDPSVVPACVNFCAPAPDPGNELGARCIVDPCDQELLMSEGAFMCPAGFACRPDGGDPEQPLGACVRNGVVLGHACEQGVDWCETGTYCRPTRGPINGGGPFAT